MPNRVLGLFLILLIIGTSSCKSARLRKDKAAEQIIGLKNGFLLMRLKTSKPNIDAYISAGLPDKAKRRDYKQALQNQYFLSRFKNNFDFCPVYFFISLDGKKIREGKLEGLIFDADRNKIPIEELEGKPYLIAAYDEVSTVAVQNDAFGLIVIDTDFSELEDPFPRAIQGKFDATTVFGVPKDTRLVARLNSSFHRFYLYGDKRLYKRQLRRQRKALKQKYNEENG